MEINTVAKYKYLFAEGNETKPTNDILEHNESITENSLIIRDEYQYRYIHFNNVEEYQQVYLGTHLNHEVISDWRKQKPRFDIDSGDNKLLEDIIEAIQSTFDYRYDTDPIICDCDSSSKDKFSHHLIITNVCFVNQTEFKWFCKKLKKDLTDNQAKCIDWAICNSNHNLRLANSTKDRRQKKIPAGFTFGDTVVCNCKDLSVLTRKAKSEHIILNCMPEDVPTEIFKSIPDGFKFKRQSGNILQFNRISATYCDICQREHTSVGMYIAIFDNAAYRFCYRDSNRTSVKIYKKDEVIFKSYAAVTAYYNGNKFDKPKSVLYDELTDAFKQILKMDDRSAASTIFVANDEGYDIFSESAFVLAISRRFCYANNGEKIKFSDVFSTKMNKLVYRKGVVFRPMQQTPDAINLFTGYKAKVLDTVDMKFIEPILGHIKVVLANNNEEVYEYILDWIAALLQMRNGRKLGTALVFYSKKHGAGKNTITSFLRDKVIGTDYVAETNDISSIVTKFNARFANKILTIVNEANNCSTNPEYHKTFDKIKDIIDNRMITIEKKGVDPVSVEDYNHLIITTNNRWPVKIEESDRRFTLLETNDQYCELTADNISYFNNINKYTNYEFSKLAADNFLTFSMSRDVERYNYKPLQTKFKKELIERQKRVDIIVEFMNESEYEVEDINIDKVYQDYIQFCQRNAVDKYLNKIVFIKKLREEEFIEGEPDRRMIDGVRIRYYRLNKQYIRVRNVLEGI